MVLACFKTKQTLQLLCNTRAELDYTHSLHYSRFLWPTCFYFSICHHYYLIVTHSYHSIHPLSLSKHEQMEE